MPYAEGRIIHDADSHVMETPDWLAPFTDARLRARLADLRSEDVSGEYASEFTRAEALHTDPEYRARDEAELMSRKNWRATGAYRREDRAGALDLLGFASQLVFPTYGNTRLEGLECARPLDVDLVYQVATATNRAQVEFCRVDPRLLAVGYVPLADLERAPQAAAEAIELGCAALLVPAICPQKHATSHIALDGVWARAREARLPILFHVGSATRVLPPAHANNGLPEVLDFHGGAENFRSISYMAIPSAPMGALSTLILDGVLDRFPDLMFGVIELGAVWVPSFMRQLDAAYEAFARHEERLQKLSLRPSEYVTRQVRVTPYPTEPTGWIIENAGPEICMFSSDYPHVEGGRNPLKRFAQTTQETGPAALERFYRTNFEELMGAGLP
ncbi:MAG: amidohydrolase [Proteobacteria bacterium]|nr:amidohydrolase [Pseudomonadota bacterium]